VIFASRPRPSWPLGLALSLLAALAGACGGGGGSQGTAAALNTATEPADEEFPADASAVHYHPMHHAAFGPWYGSGCPDNGACGCEGATTLEQEFTCQMDNLTTHDIPVSVYLFDGSAWSSGHSEEDNTCSGPECCNWKLGDKVISRLGQDDVRALLHFWGGCHGEEQYDRAARRLGRNLLGFYLDDGSSDEELAGVSEFMQGAIPGNWEVVAKAFQNRDPSTSNPALSKWANAAYVGDLSYDFEGLKEAVTRMLAKGRYIPAPFAEFTGYRYEVEGRPDAEVYYRRLAFGALQPVMAHTPYGNADPWSPGYPADLVNTYRYYARLHRELVPYFYSYAYRMHEDPTRPLLRRGPMAYSLRVGSELYVPIVTERTSTMTVQLPSGSWIDYWDESRLLTGTLDRYAVPLGREPIFIRQGALIPMEVERAETGHGTAQSRGSLTVLVYPSGSTSFRYREDAFTPWVTFSSTQTESQLTLEASPAPSQPVLYRIGRWDTAPVSVGVEGTTVTVNQGGTLARGADEAAVNGSPRSAWYWDARAQRLIVKLVP
jgi:hypothetical protein